MQLSTPFQQLFFVTCRIAAASAGRTWTGTGFVYNVQLSTGEFAPFVVTNRHVLADAKEIALGFIRREGDEPVLGEEANFSFSLEEAVWNAHPEPHVDVAALALGPWVVAAAHNGMNPFFRAVSPEMCWRLGHAVEIDAVEEVTFVGYPHGIYDRANFLPVARRGTTATPIEVDYCGLPAFLIDGSVFPGSSGSPVFLVDRGSRIRHWEGQVQFAGPRVVCLGVLAAVHVRQIQGDIVELPTRFAVQIDDPLNLGIVFRAETIDACVDPILAAAQLTRQGLPTAEATAAA